MMNIDRKTDLSFLPHKLLDRLMSFQKDGVLFALNHDGRCLIGDEMGLGKTLQALSVAYYYRKEWPLLIVTPSSLRYPWIDEIEKWFPEIDPFDINLIQAGTDIANISNSKITVVTYGLLRCPSSTILQEALLNQEFKVVIVDESHYLKNRRSQTSKYLVPLIQKASHRILLTGTPALSRPEELFPQVDAVCRGKFGTWSQYAKRYCDAKWQYFGRQRKQWKTNGASNLQELESSLRHYCMIRRLKKDVLTQLPPKQRQKISFPLKDSSLRKDLEQTWKELDASMGRGMSMNTILDGDQQGTKEVSGTSTFEIHRLISTVYRKTAAIKIGPVKDYVKMLCENQGMKFLIFAHHHVMMDAINEQLNDDKISFIRIDGNTDKQERPGLTLTAAKLVVFAELDWTPGVLEQCEDRAHRIGQEDTVHVQYLVAKGTLDEWVWSALAKKTTVVSTTLNGKRQVLQMDEGHQGQIDCLAEADAWIPREKADNEGQDIGTFFSTQQPKNQRSLLAYFTPKGLKRKRASNSDGESPSKTPKSHLKKTSRDETVVTHEKMNSTSASNKQQLCPTKRDHSSDHGLDTKSLIELEDAIVIDSDSDNDFRTHTSLNENLTRSNFAMKKTGKETQDSEWSCSLCTFLNHQSLPFCEICSSARDINKSKLAVFSESVTVDEDVDEALPDIALTCSSTQSQSKQSGILGNHTNSRTKRGLNLTDKKSRSKLKGKESKTETKQRDPSRRDSGEDFTGLWGLSLDVIDSDLEEDNNLKPATSTCVNKNENEHLAMTNVSEDVFHVTECTDDNEDEPVQSIDAEPIENLNPHEFNDRFKPNDQTLMELSHVSSSFEMQNASGNESRLDKSMDEIVKEEVEAAVLLFSPQTSSTCGLKTWTCRKCDAKNQAGYMACEGCLASRPRVADVGKSVNYIQRNVNLDNVPLYEVFHYGCSLNTTRIYLYDNRGRPLHVNFQPLDVEMQNLSALPDILLHPQNFKLIKRFLREWNSLAATKRCVIVKSRETFANPLMMYEKIKMRRVQASNQRFTTKADVAEAALIKASAVSGSIRIVKPKSLHSNKKTSSPGKKTPQKSGCAPGKTPERKTTPSKEAASHQVKASEISSSRSSRRTKKSPLKNKRCVSPAQRESVVLPETVEDFEKLGGLIQALDANGIPLCVTCQEPYDNKLVSERTTNDNPWLTRFCSYKCAEQLWTRRHGTFTKKRVFELEHGVCQICGFDAQDFFKRISVTQDYARRAELIQDSIYSCFKPGTKEKMVRNPHAGQFWQVDHINPVADGGGECDIDNLRTLCTCCHRDITNKQNKERAARRRQPNPSVSKTCRNITDFFKPSC